MSLREGENQLSKEKHSVDSQVKIRFGLLVRETARLTSREVDRRLLEKALRDSPGASLNDLIKTMVKEVAYGQARLSLTEFVDRFRKNKMSEAIAARFANSLYGVDHDESLQNNGNDTLPNYNVDALSQIREIVRENVENFLDDNQLTSTETLYEFLKQQKTEWPMVDMSNLFLEESVGVDNKGRQFKTTLREKVARKIDDSLEGIAAAAYKEKFKEDKRGFVMGFMMGRVVRYDAATKKMSFDAKEFSNLIIYLDSVDSSLSDIEGGVLYDWLYYESREMAKYVEEQKIHELRFGVRGELARAGALDLHEVRSMGPQERLFFEEDFDVKSFHDHYIKPALFRYHSKKLKKLKVVRDVDRFNNLHDTVNLGRSNYTMQMRQYVRDLLDMRQRSPKRFLMKLRETLGLQKSPLLKKMTNDDVEKHFRYYLGQVEEKFQRVVNEALAFRKDQAIRDACQYPQEIMQCRDISQLLQWFVDPTSFKRQFSGHADMPNEQIGYICAMWLRDFMCTMDRMSEKEFVEAERRRNLLETDMKESLKLKVLKNVEVQFRILEELDDKGSSYSKPRYRVAINASGLKGFFEEQDEELNQEVLARPDLKFVNWDGKKYKVYPVEQKKFKKVRMTIPVLPMGKGVDLRKRPKPVVTEALIYSGDNHFIHVKEELTRLISQDRGKEVTDESRWMLSFADPVGQEAFKSFLLDRNPQGLIKAEDSEEGRFISNKISQKAHGAESTKIFKEGQDFAHTLKMSYASEMPRELLPETGGPVFHTEKAMLETQCHNLSKLFISNLSKYTIASHDDYRAQRAWPLLFNNYFPPEFFGDQFKEFQNQGYATAE